MSDFSYTGERTRAISFPLGGIGAGCVGLAGNGRLIDWEIFNKPNKNSLNAFTHFAIRTEREGKVIDTRILQSPLMPPYMGDGNNFGFGPSRYTLAGAPCFDDVEFIGQFPFAQLNFESDAFPGIASLSAFSSFIPLNEDDSSLPAAFFEIDITNTNEFDLDYTVAFSVGNPNKGAHINRFFDSNGIATIDLSSTSNEEDDANYGSISIATDSDDVSFQEYWYRGGWFDGLTMYWNQLIQPGKLPNRTYSDSNGSQEDMATLCAHVSCAAGENKRVRFVMSWYYPNCYKYWQNDTPPKRQWRNYYSKLFSSASDVAVYCTSNFSKLKKLTSAFNQALLTSTMPESAMDAVISNLSLLISPTCLRLENGEFYGWEGCHCNGGCCEGSCTHVWNYAYALPYLFPRLERSMRNLDYEYNFLPSGAMPFRLQLPLGTVASTFRPCADGQFGGIIKLYREWMVSGDTDWLVKLWPKVKLSIEYAWSPYNADRWDLKKTGVLWGRQHHTLDMELFSPNSWLTGFYLAALKAGSYMAQAVGDHEAADEYMKIFESGKVWVDENLFNGEYYHQLIDLGDKDLLSLYPGMDMFKEDVIKSYWNDEVKQIKYQIGEGCGIDQIVAQWHANLIGLGDVYDNEQCIKSLQSIFKYNYTENIGQRFNPCRLYCLHDEAGTQICTYPEGRVKPTISVPYAQETMHGFEYQVGIHMLQEGMLEEGFTVIAAVRDRYDGAKRNPWNEIECGSNYARSMASYAIVPTLLGFHCDMTKNALTFNPKLYDDESCFKMPWSVDCAWGIFEVAPECTVLSVMSGTLKLEYLNLPFMYPENVVKGNMAIKFHCHGSIMHFRDLMIHEGEHLCIN